MTRTRWILLLVVACAIGLFFALDLGRFLSLDYLQQSRASFLQRYDEAPWTVRGLYFAVYVLVTALSLPGALPLTLAAGALFGLGWGLVLVSFASSLGATAAFWVARFVLRDSVQARFGSRLQEINRNLERDGALYLLSLRLIPVIPFFVINLAMGLTALRTWTFYWVSQAGMLAGTLLYVNAGTQLASLKSLSDISSPALLASLTLLGVFPWLVKKFWSQAEIRRRYRPWKALRPRTFDRNLIVIGGGAAGLVSTYIAAAVKARVTLVEARQLGGDCLNSGCVPSKALIRSARLMHQMRHAGQFGVHSGSGAAVSPPDFQQVMRRVQQVIASVAPHDSVERYTGLGAEVLLGRATIVSPWAVQVQFPDGRVQTLTTRSIVIATGASPVIPDLPGLEHTGYVTSDTLWERFANRTTAPAQLVVLGGGPIGCELAQSFARLGSQVTLVEAGPALLSREDAEVSEAVCRSLQADGVRVLAGHTALHTALAEGSKVLTVRQPDGTALEIPFEELLIAVGRKARLQGFGLETLGIPTGKTVETDAWLQTIYPNIFAAGDVAGPYQFTHTAAHQAWYAAVNALFGDFRKFKADYSVIPSVTFTDPEVARVGLSRNEATAQGIPFEWTRFDLDDLDRALTDSEARGFIQVLTVPGRDRILGVTIVGSHAGELLAEYVLAMKHGLGLNRILGTIHSYPTWSEANKYVAGAWKRNHQPHRLLAWVERYHAWRRK